MGGCDQVTDDLQLVFNESADRNHCRKLLKW